MNKLLGTAIAAVALSWASASAASTSVTIDFEDGVVGDQYDISIPNLNIGWDFKVGEIGGNKYVELLPLQSEELPTSLFTIIGPKYTDQDGRKYQISAVAPSLDVYLGSDGFIAPNGNHSVAIPLAAGWHTLSPVCGSPCYLYIHAPDVRIDNLVLSFDATSVPEPATWAMMVAGFGLAGAAVRSSRMARSARRPA